MKKDRDYYHSLDTNQLLDAVTYPVPAPDWKELAIALAERLRCTLKNWENERYNIAAEWHEY